MRTNGSDSAMLAALASAAYWEAVACERAERVAFLEAHAERLIAALASASQGGRRAECRAVPMAEEQNQ
jgi:hypothetical protein